MYIKCEKTFGGVQQKLRAMGLKYMMLYPAKLKVLHESQSHFFVTPEEVWDWLEVRGDGRIPVPGVGRISDGYLALVGEMLLICGDCGTRESEVIAFSPGHTGSSPR